MQQWQTHFLSPFQLLVEAGLIRCVVVRGERLRKTGHHVASPGKTPRDGQGSGGVAIGSVGESIGLKKIKKQKMRKNAVSGGTAKTVLHEATRRVTPRAARTYTRAEETGAKPTANTSSAERRQQAANLAAGVGVSNNL